MKIIKNNNISLIHLFFTFLKIGATSFGGFMALISVVQNQLVTKDKIIDDEAILDGISLASILPGPVAVNFVTYIGFTFRGIRGALVSMSAVILPSFILMLLLAYIYFTYGNIFYFSHFFKGVVPSVAAIILVVAATMAKKHIKNFKQLPIMVIAAFSVYFFKGFYTTFIIIGIAGFIGTFLYSKEAYPFVIQKNRLKIIPFLHKTIDLILAKKYKILIALLFLLLILVIQLFFIDLVTPYFRQLGQIFLTFSSISIFLFGGGYVFIPTIQDVVVNQLQWLSSTEFVDAIALGQVTPGPILISATFIGFKVSGLGGALVATMAIFFPPALLTILLSKFYATGKNFLIVEAIFKGIRPAVIGMIFSAVPIIFLSAESNMISIIIFLITAILAYQFKINAVVLIPLAGIIGIIAL